MARNLLNSLVSGQRFGLNNQIPQSLLKLLAGCTCDRHMQGLHSCIRAVATHTLGAEITPIAIASSLQATHCAAFAVHTAATCLFLSRHSPGEASKLLALTGRCSAWRGRWLRACSSASCPTSFLLPRLRPMAARSPQTLNPAARRPRLPRCGPTPRTIASAASSCWT